MELCFLPEHSSNFYFKKENSHKLLGKKYSSDKTFWYAKHSDIKILCVFILTAGLRLIEKHSRGGIYYYLHTTHQKP